MIAFYLLFALAFAANDEFDSSDSWDSLDSLDSLDSESDSWDSWDSESDSNEVVPPTKPNCNIEKYAKLNENEDGCECIATFEPVDASKTGEELECECKAPKTIVQENGADVCKEPEDKCPGDHYDLKDNSETECECKDGYQPNTDEATKTETPCVCPATTHEEKEGKCEKKQSTELTCPEDKHQVLNTEKTACVCAEGYENKPTEEKPNELNCVEKPTEITCPEDKHQVLNTEKTACICVEGYENKPTEEKPNELNCKAKQEELTCPEDQHQVLNEEKTTCVCIEGYENTAAENEPIKCEAKPTDDGVNGIFLILAVALFFLF